MALLSPLRSRRLAQQEALRHQQKLITFQLGSYNFGLPILRAQRVLAWQDIQGELRPNAGNGIPSIRLRLSHQSSEADPFIPLLNPGRLLLGKHLPFQPQTLILLQRPDQQQVGLPIPTPPLLRRLPLSQLQPVPSRNAAQARQRGIVQWVPASGTFSHLFIIDPDLWFTLNPSSTV
ncbi:chemotaxis protein CheW [Thermostichus vulcanus]|uniref:chemotaxis protein CheW n=1 Tax=Thermostichus vulcanus TaxID=32053 RepID=UPI001FCBA101|nr:chemotaxis protein CheW [Thermostichus vulcanus]